MGRRAAAVRDGCDPAPSRTQLDHVPRHRRTRPTSGQHIQGFSGKEADSNRCRHDAFAVCLLPPLFAAFFQDQVARPGLVVGAIPRPHLALAAAAHRLPARGCPGRNGVRGRARRSSASTSVRSSWPIAGACGAAVAAPTTGTAPAALTGRCRTLSSLRSPRSLRRRRTSRPLARPPGLPAAE